jgi:hypothetical protein
LLVVVLARGQAVVQAAEEVAEQVALGSGVPVASGAALVVVLRAPGEAVMAENAQLYPVAARRWFLTRRCSTAVVSGQLVRARSPGPPDLACETLPCRQTFYWMILDQLSLDALRGSRPGTIGEADEKAMRS